MLFNRIKQTLVTFCYRISFLTMSNVLLIHFYNCRHWIFIDSIFEHFMSVRLFTVILVIRMLILTLIFIHFHIFNAFIINQRELNVQRYLTFHVFATIQAFLHHFEMLRTQYFLVIDFKSRFVVFL